ncbi:MAG: ABC transporter permease [Acidobacteriota bacterium]|nr:ABC transporter permease [Acidobacteriota bacterium]
MSFELFIALRYLLARRKQAFISLISLISTLGVAVGVMALIIALALMTGLQQELRDRIVGSTAHIYVFKVGGTFDDAAAEVKTLEAQPGVLGAAPVVMGKGILRGPDGDAFITLKGIDPALEPRVTEVSRSMKQGSLGALARQSPDDPDGIAIGEDLAASLRVSLGDTVRLLTPEGTLSPYGYIPRTRAFRIVGIYKLGLYEFDASYGFVSIGVATDLLRRAGPDFIELRAADMFEAPSLARRLETTLGTEYQLQDWSDMNSSLFSALWLEKMAISITIGLIVMVAALNIIASLILLVMEKSRDIAILKTMGCSKQRIRTIFMLQGLVIGVIGTGLGALLGLLVCFVADRYRLIQIPLDVYQISYVPFTVETSDLLAVVISSVLICFLATIYPSRQAAKLDPAQALRYQ